MSLRLIIFSILLAFSLCSAVNTAQAAEIKNIRFGKSGEATRIVLDSTGPLKYDIGTLPAPPRIVLDLPGATKLSEKHEKDPTNRIQDVRFGSPDANTARIVFDLNTPVKIVTELMLPPGPASHYHRLVLDIDKAAAMEDTLNTAKTGDTQHKKTTQLPDISQTAHYQLARLSLPTPRPSKLSRDRGSKYQIVIDPGHGGGDPGGVSKNGLYEKDIVLSIGQVLKTKLEATGRYEVHMTRDSDRYIQLRDRFQKAQRLKADLFISLHADIIDNPSVRGASVYTLSETASDAETARLAQQANTSGIIAGVDLGAEDNDVADILLDLIRRESLNESRLFADLFVVSLDDQNVRALNNAHRYAGFAVLKAPDVPSVLIEAGFMSNNHDVRLLQTRDYQTRLATSIRKAIDNFFNRIERLERG